MNTSLESKGFKFQWTRHIGQLGFYDYEEQLPRAPANYLGMLRMIDDQVKRLVEFLQDIRIVRKHVVGVLV